MDNITTTDNNYAEANVVILDHLLDGIGIDFFAELQWDLEWEQRTIKMYGKTHNIPRLTAYHGDAGKTYTYSGIVCEPSGWTPTLAVLKNIAAIAIGEPFYRFNAVLCNYYQDGDNSIAWHADDEPELTGPIVSMSFGGTRKFKIRNKHTKETITYELKDRSVLVMSEEMQKDWEHCIPKQKNAEGRINLTFRKIK
jgi:alkylated DNA repair dioxygenase AlkB